MSIGAVGQCFICQTAVAMGSANGLDEYILTLLARNGQSSRLVFHTDCFFNAAGKEYKVALGYDRMKIEPVSEINHQDTKMLAEMKELECAMKQQKFKKFQDLINSINKSEIKFPKV